MFAGLSALAKKLFWATIILVAIGGAAFTHNIWAQAFHQIGTLIGHHTVPQIGIKKN